MMKVELTADSVHQGDRVFAIVRKQKKDATGRYRFVRGEKADAFEIVEASVTELHFNWNFRALDSVWTLALTTAPSEEYKLGRFIESVMLDACFSFRKEAEEAFKTRFCNQ